MGKMLGILRAMDEFSGQREEDGEQPAPVIAADDGSSDMTMDEFALFMGADRTCDACNGTGERVYLTSWTEAPQIVPCGACGATGRRGASITAGEA